MAWTATPGTPRIEGGNVICPVTFENPDTGEKVVRDARGDTLDADALAAWSANNVNSLLTRDAAFSSLQAMPKDAIGFVVDPDNPGRVATQKMLDDRAAMAAAKVI